MSKISLDSKLPAVGTSIFSVMSALAREHGAINLSQGFPDFEVDPVLISYVNDAMRAGANQYAPSSGLPALREQIALLARESYGAVYDPEEEITVTSGATEALFCAISAVVSEGDEVIILEPAYDSYAPAIELNGGIPVFVQLSYPEYRINWDNVKKKVNSRTRLIIMNTPHNPTGAIFGKEDMEELSKIIRNNSILVLSDEVYEHIVFDGEDHQSVARFPELRERSFVVSSFGKTFHATGWKMGYCMAPAYLSKEFRKVHQYVTFSTSTPFQQAVARYMEDLQPVRELRKFYQAKRDRFLELIQGSRFKPLQSSGTYFQLLDYSAVSQKPDVEFAREMTIQHGLASIPVSVFYHFQEDHKVLRFCFAKSDETLVRAAAILRSI